MEGVCNATLYSILSNDDTLSAMYCAMNDYDQCMGICPNQDLAGVGVRVAFYLQSLMNAFLVIKSPGESAQTAWASTILTCALVIPAIIQKLQRTLTLYHATLVMNFATLSTIASLSVAPLVPIWRPTAKPTGTGRTSFAGAVVRVEREREKAKGRTVLSIALLTQIISQWSWCILMFVHPYYAQAACSPTNKLVFFGVPFEAQDINGRYFYVWALWVLLSLGSSLAWGIVLVFSAPSPVHDMPMPRPPLVVSAEQKVWVKWWEFTKLYGRWCLPHRDDHYKTRLAILSSKVAAFSVVTFLICISEVQIQINNVLPGERQLWSFSQMAAILLAIAPVWGIAAAAFEKRHPVGLPRHANTGSINRGSNKKLNGDGQAPPAFPTMPEPGRPGSPPMPPMPPMRTSQTTAAMVTLPSRAIISSILGSRARAAGQAPNTPPQQPTQFFPELNHRSASPTSIDLGENESAPSVRSLPWTIRSNPTGRPTLLDINPYELERQSRKESQSTSTLRPP